MDEATRLIKSGYCCTSNRYRMMSRLDRPDWLEHMGREHTKGFPGDPEKNFQDGMRWARGLGNGAADFYRRVHSKDKIEGVPQPIYDKVKKSGPGAGWGGVNDYRELVPAEETTRTMAE